MLKIFISYRHDDTAIAAGRIEENIKQYFPDVFIDTGDSNVPPGRPLGSTLKNRLEYSNIMLVVIGEKWVNIQDDKGRRRIDDETDWVHIEVKTALEFFESGKYKAVIPLCIDARFPQKDDLPLALQPLTDIVGITITGKDFRGGIQKLINALTYIESLIKQDTEVSQQTSESVDIKPDVRAEEKRVATNIKENYLVQASVPSSPKVDGLDIPDTALNSRNVFPIKRSLAAVLLVLFIVGALVILRLVASSQPESTPTPLTIPTPVAANPTLPPTAKVGEVTPAATALVGQTSEATSEATAPVEQMSTITASTIATSITPTSVPSLANAVSPTHITQPTSLPSTDTPTPTPISPSAVPPSATPVPPTATLTVPTVTPRPGFPGGAPILHNQDWQPVYQTIDGVQMALVPAGCFDMGDNGAGGRQCLPLFFIDVFEVTNQQFTDKAGFAVQSSYFAPGDQPRERISWIEARGFCEKRGGRLPTEAEWEYAARGPDNLLYPWGNTFDPRYAIYRLNSDFHTWPVGGNRLTSWVGASDMSGNVREWTNSIYLDYPFNPTDGRESLNTVDPSSARVIRGGSWNSLEGDLVLTQRDRLLPYNSEYTVGFRCVRSFSGS